MDINGETALEYAIDNGHESVLRELLSEKASMSRAMSSLNNDLQRRRRDVAARKREKCERRQKSSWMI